MNSILYIVLFIVGLFVFMQVFMRVSTYLKKGKKIEGLKGDLGKKVSRGGKHLFYFYTNSCAACKPMGPVIDSIKKDFKNVHKINLATDMETGRLFGVMGTPSTVILEDGKISAFNVGVKTEPFLRNLLA